MNPTERTKILKMNLEIQQKKTPAIYKKLILEIQNIQKMTKLFSRKSKRSKKESYKYPTKKSEYSTEIQKSLKS